MVFAALLEYAAVGYIGKRISMRKNKYQSMMKSHEERRRRLIMSNDPEAHMYQHADNAQSGGQSTLAAAGGGGQLDQFGNQVLFSNEPVATMTTSQPPVPAMHQYVQLSGNNMLSTTQTPYAQASSALHPHHPAAQYATIRRNVLERASSLGCTANATPRLVQRPQAVSGALWKAFILSLNYWILLDTYIS